MDRIEQKRRMFAELDFENLVARHYGALYRFALSLTQQHSEACDLTQQTFYIWATKGHQLQDASKVKTWLFTTLNREFLQNQRKRTRFQHSNLDEAEEELPQLTPAQANQLDSSAVLQALGQLGSDFQAPIALFYLEDYSYAEIAGILEIPLGTVKSRISRGLARLQRALSENSQPPPIRDR